MGKRGLDRVSCDACYRRKIRCEVSPQHKSHCAFCNRRGQNCTFGTQPPHRKSQPNRLQDSSVASVLAHSPISNLELTNESQVPYSSYIPIQNPSDILPSFLQQPDHTGQVSIDPTTVDDADYMSLIAAFLAIPSTPNPSSIMDTAVHHSQNEEEAALISFLRRESIIPDIIQPIWTNRSASHLDHTNPWTDIMRKAMVCSGLSGGTGVVGPEIYALAQDILLSIRSLLADQNVRLEIEATCILVIMSEIWPMISSGEEAVPVSVLSIDPRSVEAMTRVCATFFAEVNPAHISPAWEILHWYVYIIDAMHTADKGCSPHLHRTPPRAPLEAAYGTAIADQIWHLASSGRAIGEAMDHRPGPDGARVASLIAMVQKLQHSTSLTASAVQLGKEARLRVVMTVLGHHCALALEAHLPKVVMGRGDIEAFAVRRSAQAAAASAWYNIILKLETQLAASPSSLRISSAIVEIGLGSLFWGINVAHQALLLDQRDELISLLSGSKRLISVLEYTIQHRPDLIHRLETLKTRLQSLSNST